ncbi:PKD domain-containing protein [Aquimarina macrocephali]|uniref:PKD domain-containing protein n=1 Tax=Aquimarina macrocephali TaxID=666563 RepID=UPI003F67CD7F
MRTLFLSFLLMVYTMAIGQEAVPTPLEEALQVFPVSPEAASLGKYGDIPVNLASGKINYTVPIYTIQHGGYEWPIYLSYNYSGLINEQDHPMTGLGWDVMANGRITRQVRGVDDDYGNQTYKGSTMIPYLQGAYNNLSDAAFKAKQFEVYDNIGNRNIDAQQDKYGINVSGLDGSFVFNEAGEIVFLNYKNYKVQKNGNTFTIVDDKGITYYFDTHEIGTYSYSAGSESVDHSVPMSYLLTRIELPNTKGSIYFEYAPAESYGKLVVSESETVVNGMSTPNLSHSRNSITRHTLQKITFPNGEVRFDISSATDQSVATQALHSISVWNQSKQIVKYDFTYNDPTKNRKTLLSITKSNAGVTLPWYQFEYHSFPNTLPETINYKYQDFWGYYNGVGNSLLSTEGRVIDQQKTRSGALTKITYPTKGYSEITYEQNRVAVDNGGVGTNCTYSHNKIINKTIKAESGFNEVLIDTIIQVPANQVVRVYSQLTLGEGAGNGFIGTEADVTIATAGNSCGYDRIYKRFTIHGETISCEGANDCDDTYYSDPYEKLGYTSDGKIRITGRLLAPLNTSAYFKYIIRYEERVDNNVLYKHIGGVRVEQTKDCDGDGNCKTKSYKYVTEDGTDSGLVLSNPSDYQYTTTHIDKYVTTIQVHRSAVSMANFTSYQGAPVFYPRVEIWEEDGGNGKTVNQYSSMSNGGSVFPFVSPPSNAWQTGKLLKSEVFAKRGQNFVLQNETIHEYDNVYPYGVGVSSTVKAYGMAVGRTKYHRTGEGQLSGLIEGDPKHYVENYYVDYPKEHKLIKTTTREFLHGETLTSETSYMYDDPYGQLKTQTNTDSHNNTITTNYTYPYDKSSIVNDSLVAQNRITTLVETKSTEGTTLAATQTIDFIDWGNGILLPGITKIAKGTDTPEARLTYHNYDVQGNPLEVSQVDGRHIMYVWGYNNTLPIAKIDNASYTGIPATATALITQLQTASNTEDTADEEVTMRNLFKDLREHTYFKNAEISGYTYDPLIGVTSMTDPEGYTIYYQYDDFNRLQYTLDQEQYVAQQLRYNYQGQQSDVLGDVTIQLSASGSVQPNQSVTFTANTSGSGGANLYTWSVDGTQEQCDSTTSFTKTFASEGTYTVTVLAYNTQTKHRVSKTMNVVVAYPPINIPVLSANYSSVITGTNVNFSASGIGGGTGDLRYEWYVNTIKQASTATTFTYTNNTAGTYTVYFKVIDNRSGKSTDSEVRLLHMYNPLIAPVISASKAHIVQGATTTFTASGIGGGSGSRSYEWYVNDVKQSATGTTYSYHFPNSGTYTIKFKVVDLTLQNANYKWGGNAPVLKSYPGMVASTSQSHTSISGSNPSVTFNVTSLTGGSGNSQITWKAYNSINLSQALGSGSGTNFGFSNFATGTHEYTIQAKIKDNLTGQEITKVMVVVATVSTDTGGGGNTGEQH